MHGARIRAFAAVDGVHRRCVSALHALHQGLWLGLLDDHDLDRLAILQYGRWPAYSDDSYNASGLWAWETDAIRAHFGQGGGLLVAGAGGGREVVALARLGYAVDGFDCVEPLVEYGRAAVARLNLQARLFDAAPGRVPDGLGRYAGIVVGWGAYMHIPGAAQRVAFLRDLRRHVDAGAPLLVSFFTRNGRSRRLDWTWRIARALRRARRSADPVEYGDTLDGTFDHLFTRDEVERELDAAGFALVTYADKPYGHAVGKAVDA